MSYVVTVRRARGTAPLTASDVTRLQQGDASLSMSADRVLVWTDPGTGDELHVNVDDTQLWTDGVRGPAADAFLEKLRSIAIALDARVVGEEGEDLTEDEPPAPGGAKSPALGALGAVIAVVALPFLALVFVLRLPWILWKILRAR